MPSRTNHTAESVTLATAVSTLAFPPVQFALVDHWNSSKLGAIPEFDLEIWSTGTLSFTASELFGGKLRALVNPDDTFTAASSTDTFTAAGHGLQTGDGPFRVSNAGGALPAGLVAGTDYWIVRSTDDDFKLATTLANAMAHTPVIVDVSTNGTGVQTISDLAATQRVYWHSHGTLTTPISLTSTRAFAVRCAHRPDVIAYALVGTLSAGTVSAAVCPIVKV